MYIFPPPPVSCRRCQPTNQPTFFSVIQYTVIQTKVISITFNAASFFLVKAKREGVERREKKNTSMAREKELQAQVAYLKQELQSSHHQNHTLRQVMAKLLNNTKSSDMEWQTLVHFLLTDLQALTAYHNQTHRMTQSLHESLSL